MRLRKTRYFLLFFVVLLIGLRLWLPHGVLKYVNKTLNQLPDYQGIVKDVDIALIRGAYTIKGFSLQKRDGKVLQPFVNIPETDLSIEWRQLFNGKLVGEIVFEKPKINLVNGPTDKEAQFSTKGNWQKMVGDLFPLTINNVEIEQGAITYREESSDKKESIRFSAISGSVQNLSNRPQSRKDLPSPMQFEGLLQEFAQVVVKGKLDPLARSETFDIDLHIKQLPLEKLNDFLRQSLFVDAQSGTFELFGEVACKEGKFKGYVKPLLKDVQILSISKDGPNPFAILWEGLTNLIFEVFTNQRHRQFASSIPIEGNLSDPNIGIFQALYEIVRNAYVRALKSKVDDSINITSVEP